ncbi:GtrA family protein [Sporolactobacillus sp. CPB3-1]|uniref:GtrA family protein n=1 Tax=Sporolactobacillus mangiferae TaxID=2940498 RepID=A0ABT0M805_9BACL|nr:GtrA family protein [Sporolactobacillus mangiferae]MCL1631007.1 GtrA family protein [Sporolactobacillus mangiferae]
MGTQSKEKIMDQLTEPAVRKGNWMRQAISFGLIGVSNTAVDFIVFFLLTHFLYLYYAPAQVLSYSSGMLNSYLWNSKITFSGSTGSFTRIIRFVLLNVAVLGITLISMHLLLFLPLYVNKLFSTLIGMTVNFLLSKLWVFRI